MKRIKNIVLILIAVVITACGFDLNSTIYVQDIVDIASMNAAIYTNATITISYMEEDGLGDFETLLIDHLSNVENVRLEEIDYSEAGVAEFSIPIVSGETFPGSDEIFTVYVKHQDGKALIYFVINQEKYEALDQGVYDLHFQNLDLKESNIKLEIVNDARQDILFTTSGSFVNGSPEPFEKIFTIDHRDSIEILLGDVLKESFQFSNDSDPKGYTIRLIATMDIP